MKAKRISKGHYEYRGFLINKGHITRYKEVIEILEMLGGKNEQGHNGNNPKVAYYICDDNIIRCDCVPNIYPNIYKCVDYALESFNYMCKNNIDFRGLIEKGLAIDATGKNIY